MKKLIFFLFPLVLVFIISGCGNKTYDEITYKEFNELINKKENFVLFIGSKGCSHCDAYKVTLNKVIEKYGLDVKYIDISKLKEKEISNFQSKFPFSGTPTTIFITKGKEISTFNRIEGAKEYSKVKKIFEKNNYIKE